MDGNSVKTNNYKEIQEDDTSAVDVKPNSKRYSSKRYNNCSFVKFVNGLLDIMDEDESLVMDNARIYKPISTVQKIEASSYRVVNVSPPFIRLI